jgi:predicted ATPase/DNA-binding SARP family transcriptional activator
MSNLSVVIGLLDGDRTPLSSAGTWLYRRPTSMEFRILGPLELASGDAPPGKQGALLGLLLLRPNRAVSIETMIDRVWGADPPPSAENLVQGYISRLRKTLGKDRIETVGHGYVIHVQDDELDSLRFCALVAKGRRAFELEHFDRASTTFSDALEMWYGELLGGTLHGVEPEVARLNAIRAEVLERRIAADLELGRHLELISELEAFVSADPARERPWAFLMLALYRSSRQTEALEQYRVARAFFVEQIGIEPSATLRDLEGAILRQDPALEYRRAKPKDRLTVPPTPFFGREQELEHASALLRRPHVRLLTLIGTGGIGKSRLAIELAGAVADVFRDGVCEVPLASIADPELVLPAIARALDVAPLNGEVTAGLRRYLRDRQMLLVLDNFEHVLQAGRDLLDLLTAAPSIKLLVTSTAALRLSAEREFPVPPLELPAADTDYDIHELLQMAAIQLFVSRAQASNPFFELNSISASGVSEICRRLEGLPLAIELAAARTKLFPPPVLLGRLRQRLDFLAGGVQDMPERHRTLRATIDWSYRLLNPAEKRLFASLAVFSGGWTFEAAEVVCGEHGNILDELISLADKSLVFASGSDGRLWMFETQREYALEILQASGEETQVRLRHLEYFVGMAETAEPELTGPIQLAWYERLETENDNFRAALAFAVERRNSKLALRLAAALTRFWDVRGHVIEGLRWFREALTLEDDTCLRVRADALAKAGVLCLRGERHSEARDMLTEARSILSCIHDARAEAFVDELLGQVAFMEGDREGALKLFRRAACSFRKQGRLSGLQYALSNIAMARLLFGDFESAVEEFAAALELSTRLGDRQAESSIKLNLGIALFEMGEIQKASTMFTESFTVARELGFKAQLADVLDAFGFDAARAMQYYRAARLMGAAEALRESAGTVVMFVDVHDRVVASIVAALGSDGLGRAWVEGRALELDDALDYALPQAVNRFRKVADSSS